MSSGILTSRRAARGTAAASDPSRAHAAASPCAAQGSRDDHAPLRAIDPFGPPRRYRIRPWNSMNGSGTGREVPAALLGIPRMITKMPHSRRGDSRPTPLGVARGISLGKEYALGARAGIGSDRIAWRPTGSRDQGCRLVWLPQSGFGGILRIGAGAQARLLEAGADSVLLLR